MTTSLHRPGRPPSTEASHFRVYGPDFQLRTKEHSDHGLRWTTTEQHGWWQEAVSLEHARQLARDHGDGRYLIVRYLPRGMGAVRHTRDREAGQEIYMVDGRHAYPARAIR